MVSLTRLQFRTTKCGHEIFLSDLLRLTFDSRLAEPLERLERDSADGELIPSPFLQTTTLKHWFKDSKDEHSCGPHWCSCFVCRGGVARWFVCADFATNAGVGR